VEIAGKFTCCVLGQGT